MGIEIERKFLVKKEKWQELNKPAGQVYRQGFLLIEPQKTIRVRQTPEKGFLTIKGVSVGASRPEYEYEIPLEEAKKLLDQFANSELSKIRYVIFINEKKWEIDVFLGDNEGLIVAEIELETEDEKVEIPDWIDCEVTSEEKYYNSNLTLHPYKNW